MTAQPKPFPWQGAMGFAFAVLHLSPEQFWAMTPRELAAAIQFARGGAAGEGADHNALAQLMAAFPDTPDNKAE